MTRHGPSEVRTVVYPLYREHMDQIRDGSMKELQIALSGDEAPSVGDVLTFVDRSAGPPKVSDGAPTADSVTVRVASVRPVGEDRGFTLWCIGWEGVS
jgi:hypothetical protein